jgi:hypothetical protein
MTRTSVRETRRKRDMGALHVRVPVTPEQARAEGRKPNCWLRPVAGARLWYRGYIPPSAFEGLRLEGKVLPLEADPNAGIEDDGGGAPDGMD